MVSSSVRSFVIVFSLLLVIGFISVGCKPKGGQGMVNTNSMPGHTFQKYRRYINYDAKPDKSTIVKSTNNNPDANFGPRDISFDFKDLK